MRENVGWQVEGIVNFLPNVESFLLNSGSRRWYVVGAYMPPHDAPAAYRTEKALEVAPRRMEVILLGNSNVRLREPRDNREDELTS